VARSRKIPLISQTHEVEVRPAFRGHPAEIRTMTVGEHVCWLIESTGCGVETAAAIVEVAAATLWKWQARGKEWIDEHAPEADGEPVEIPEAERPYVKFVEGLKKARGEAEVFHLRNIKAHTFANWQASAWYLERVRPERYGRRSRHEVTGEGGGPVKHEVFVPPSEEWEEHVERVIVEAELAKRRRANA
jgi:hypothetical protein